MEKFSSCFNTTKPKVSCIMSCYSEIPEHLCMAIESIINQTYQNFEFLIALDNPENQELLRVLKVYEEKDKRIKVFVNPKNLGRSQSRNNLIKKAQGEYIAIMDADDIATPDRFELEVAALEEGICDVVGSWIEEFDDNPEVIVSKRKVPEKHDDIVRFAKYRNPVNHVTIMFNKQIFDKIGGYENYDMGEDYHFVVRAIVSGYRLYNIQKILCKVRKGTGFIKRRRGLKIFSQDFRLYSEFYSMGYLNFYQLAINVAIRALLRLSPMALTSLLYRIIRKIQFIS